MNKEIVENNNCYATRDTDDKELILRENEGEANLGITPDLDSGEPRAKIARLDDDSTGAQQIQSRKRKKPHPSPKKRLEVSQSLPVGEKQKSVFAYGNYSRYYGYRNLKDFHDIRLDVFAAKQDLFESKTVLDIGCNSGLITMEIAKHLAVQHITGIDIDKSLINSALKHLRDKRKKFLGTDRTGFPFNLTFVHGNYVLRDEVLLEIERPQFDLILCLSVTKWIHLNFGDAGLKLAFRRMYAQLRHGGRLVLEAQPWNGYKKRKKLTPEIFQHYQKISLKPEVFTEYLLSAEVGFSEVEELQTPEHSSEGFRRPILVFTKRKVRRGSRESASD